MEGVDPPPCPRTQGKRVPLPRSRGRVQNGTVPMRWSRGLGVRPQTYLPHNSADVSHQLLYFFLFWLDFIVTYAFCFLQHHEAV